MVSELGIKKDNITVSRKDMNDIKKLYADIKSRLCAKCKKKVTKAEWKFMARLFRKGKK